jgi:hypothetical protein
MSQHIPCDLRVHQPQRYPPAIRGRLAINPSSPARVDERELASFDELSKKAVEQVHTIP